MFEYNKIFIRLRDSYDIISKMDEYGQDRWEIFSIAEVYIESSGDYEFTFYMKRIIL